ncbi:hypothetical protein Taro_007534 [Colocasia esculenta]|uniref:Protein kinase domain-containing protein n=1 Tax=Colocasia esculenta TaxID=4460 RepID=A0A843U437_COLES|nr:hypothetical protein [Colocasia esculenta]
MEAPVAFFAALLLVGLAASFPMAAAEPVLDKLALLAFSSGMPHSRPLNWNLFTPVCGNWVGVTCSSDGSRVIAVRLPAVGLEGSIPPNTLSQLTALQTLSLRSNALTGPFPADFANLVSLTDLHLQFNALSGPLPSDFSPWRNLVALDLSFNNFNGSIPSSISNLTNLAALNLSNNSLSGRIPDLQLSNLKALNLRNNHLEGPIPVPLLRFSSASFAGNDLSVAPSPSPLPPSSTPEPGAGRSGIKLSESAILGLIVGGCTLAFVMVALSLVLFCSRKGESLDSGKLAGGNRSLDKAAPGNEEGNTRLVFFEGCNFAFDLEDLLRASAEVLGKGTFGTAYKAILEDSTTVVVKRLKEVGVGKREFEQQMEVVGRIKHENVAELRAYYYSKDEKLIIYDFFSLGSVSSLLHGKREGRTPLDWESRLRVAVGAARGIAHIHAENGGKLVHGNIKSSNVFLNQQLYGCVSDVCLNTLMNPVVPPITRTAGYRAPEIVDTRKATHMSDVYSFGVLLLELLTGRSPIHIAGGGEEVVHLVRWVQSVVREEWTAEVFDVELMRYPNIEEEMVEMLQIAMACVMRVPEKRPKMVEVVKMIEEVRRVDTAKRSSSECRSEGSDSATPTAVRGTSSSFSIEGGMQRQQQQQQGF